MAIERDEEKARGKEGEREGEERSRDGE